ncbi:hypothetical protein FQN57_000271 [Myotisia sp. PD_48]|nr:hypothetical protein FQN57_000271 [Myotisia sp. PD_48]
MMVMVGPVPPVVSPSSASGKDIPPPRAKVAHAVPSALESVQGYNSISGIPPPISGGGAFGPQSAAAVYNHIHDTASKRIQTLDYIRNAHDGRVYWFNTLHFSKADLYRLPYFEKRKLTRRGINYLFLGLSLPPILDVGSSLIEYLKALNALLLEFETFQQMHPADGGTGSSLARARLPQMFKRSAHTSTKARRASSANEIGLPMQASDHSDIKAMGNVASSTNAASTVSAFPSGAESSDLLPGEEYTYLLTPTLPFDPDYFETFATLCDVLIDCYTRLTILVTSPTVCSVHLNELFTKADAKLRKLIVSSLVREFEDSSRTGVKSEIAGVSRVVLGGLLG